MNIGIDVSMIDDKKAGIGYYAYSLLEALIETDSENTYFLFTYNRDLLSHINLPKNFKIIEVSGSGNLKWMIKTLFKIRSLSIDKFLSPSNLFWGCVLNNCITVVHDIAQIIHPEFFPKKGNVFYKIELNILLRRRGIVVTPSNSVKNEIMAHFKGIRADLVVILEGLHKWTKKQFDSDELNSIKAKYKLPDKYILSVGTLEPRKNLKTVILSFSEFVKTNKEYKLVVVGKKGWFYDSILETVKINKLEDKVIFLGYIPDSEIGAIYDMCEYVILLSFYEGFGLPLIEANARNKFVLASDIPVFNELNIKSVSIGPNSKPNIIAEKMNLLVGKVMNNQDNISDIYSWKTAATKFMELWGN